MEGGHLPNGRKIHENKTANAINMIFCKCYQNQNPLGQLLKTIFKISSALGVCDVTIIGEVVCEKSMILVVFWKYFSEFLIFLREIFLVARSYRVLLKHQKFRLPFDCSYPGNESQSPDFGRFWRFWAFFELFVWAQRFSLGHWSFYKILVQCMHFYL